VFSECHEGIKAAESTVLTAVWRAAASTSHVATCSPRRAQRPPCLPGLHRFRSDRRRPGPRPSSASPRGLDKGYANSSPCFTGAAPGVLAYVSFPQQAHVRPKAPMPLAHFQPRYAPRYSASVRCFFSPGRCFACGLFPDHHRETSPACAHRSTSNSAATGAPTHKRSSPSPWTTSPRPMCTQTSASCGPVTTLTGASIEAPQGQQSRKARVPTDRAYEAHSLWSCIAITIMPMMLYPR